MTCEVTSRTPVWGENYREGYIGFTFFTESPVSQGIAYFSRWSRMSEIRVSHALIVTGEWECTEALASRGVITASLEERFVDPHCVVMFRKPMGWTPELGRRIAKAAKREVGHAYDTGLMLGCAVPNLWVMRRLLSKQAREDFEAWWLGTVENPEKWICSELAAYALDGQPELKDKGCLADANYTITPQRLFEDGEVFEEWRR